MNLLEEFGEDFAFMEKTRIPDGEGGMITTWTEGARFRGAQRHDTTIVAQEAERAKTASTYSFFVDKGIVLEMYDVVKRLRDGATFRITQPSGEDVTPASSWLNLTKVVAERWDLS